MNKLKTKKLSMGVWLRVIHKLQIYTLTHFGPDSSRANGLPAGYEPDSGACAPRIDENDFKVNFKRFRRFLLTDLFENVEILFSAF